MKWLIPLIFMSSCAWSNEKPPELWSSFKDFNKSQKECETHMSKALQSIPLENQVQNKRGIYGNIKFNRVVVKCTEITKNTSKLFVAVSGKDKDSVELLRNQIISLSSLKQKNIKKSSDEEKAALDKLIEKLKKENKNHYALRPRIGFVDSLSLKGSAEALYVESFTKKLEQIGNIHYPEEAAKQGLSGRLIANTLLDRAGRVIEIQITVSSGSSILDQAAIQLIKLAGPYPMPRKLREEYDQLNITRTLIFHTPSNKNEIFTSE